MQPEASSPESSASDTSMTEPEAESDAAAQWRNVLKMRSTMTLVVDTSMMMRNISSRDNVQSDRVTQLAAKRHLYCMCLPWRWRRQDCWRWRDLLQSGPARHSNQRLRRPAAAAFYH